MNDANENYNVTDPGEAPVIQPPTPHQQDPAPGPANPSHQRRGPIPSWETKPYRTPDPRTKSPLLAAAMSLIPGLGQIYVGYYQRGFINPLVIGGLFSLLFSSTSKSQEPPFFIPLFIIFLIFFWLYNIIDAWRRAMLYNLALEGIENVQLPDDMSAPGFGGSIFGGAVLLLLGFVALMYTRFGMPIRVLQEWWPLAPIALGGYLIFRAYQDKRS